MPKTITLDQVQVEVSRLEEIARDRTFGLDLEAVRKYVAHGYRLALEELVHCLDLNNGGGPR